MAIGVWNCRWCETEFQPRNTGGSMQKFCSVLCRRAFDVACRQYASGEVDAGRLRVSVLRLALGQRARCSDGHSFPKGTSGAP